jgi:hypothetical protein
MPNTPGKELAESESFWLAPFTLYTKLRIGSSDETRVQWFSADGRLERELRNVEMRSRGFVSRNDSSGSTYVSILNPHWEFVLPNHHEGTPYGLIVGGTADGRTFVYSSRNIEGDYDEWPRVPTTISVYVEGERRTLGPYVGAPQDFHLDASGALAVRLWDGQLVVADRNGHERFRMTLDKSMEDQVLACNDQAVLVEESGVQPIQYYG